MVSNIQKRIEILKLFGATENDLDCLIEYNKNIFDHSLLDKKKLPLDDEPFVKDWIKYQSNSQKNGIFDELKKVFIQFNFPVEAGISQTQKYTNAVKKGIFPEINKNLTLIEPEKIELTIKETPAGRIPILSIQNRNDFVTIIQAISKKNEPVDIPKSYGASMFSGYNNWNRIHSYKKSFLEKNPLSQWKGEFQNLIKQKHLYQDKFIILSNSYYSGIQPETLKLQGEYWKEKSLIIRREHECMHFFTKQCLKSMQNNVLDEIIADYAGLTAAFGTFNAKWFLTFLGLENFPKYRKSGRLEIYKGNLEGNALIVLQKLIIRAAENLEKISLSNSDTFNTAVSLTKYTLEELASENILKSY